LNIDLVSIDDIKKFFRGQIVLSESLSKYTSFRIGGPADYYLEPADKDDVVNIIRYLYEQKFPFHIIGKGTNVLVSDEGIRGAVINLEYGLNTMHCDGNLVFADSGVHLARFIDFCTQHSLKGVEMLAGIPGTVGGAIVMNAGAYGGEISTFLVEVEVLRNGNVVRVKKNEAEFAYRRSRLAGDIILNGSFDLPAGDKAEIMKIRNELLIKRNQSQPLNFPNSGSMFINPEGTYAAKLIEQAGLKGARRGKAQISQKHANFMVNTGGATAHDIMQLIELARNTVFEKFGIRLELEVKLLGFNNNTKMAVDS
jgi:UDP-N-acetylmuramate dehydrogenase